MRIVEYAEVFDLCRIASANLAGSDREIRLSQSPAIDEYGD